jgi:Sulfotransferase family
VFDQPRPRARVLFVGGTGRSGSTLLERMVGELPGACLLGEVVHLWKRSLADDERCACGAPFSQCVFWQAVGDRAFGGWRNVDATAVLRLKASVDRTRFVPRLALPMGRRGPSRDLEAYLAFYEKLYAAAAEVSGADVVVDSSKHASLAFCLRRSSRVDLRVVHIVRDSPGVAYSWSKQVRRPESLTSESWMPRYSIGRVVVDWTLGNAMFLALAVTDRVRRIRYEDLVHDPQRVLADVAHHAGLPVMGHELSFVDPDAVRLKASHSVAGNPMRFTVGTIPLVPDEEWKTRLPAGQRRVVKALTFPLRLSFRYVGAQARPARAATEGAAR